MLFKMFIQTKAVKSLWKENLNIDSHQSHQYQQNEQAPLILTELTKHNKDHDIWRWISWSRLETETIM
jgi:hypothetical protein